MTVDFVLLVSGACGQIDQFPKRLEFLAGARTQQMELDGQAMADWMLFIRPGAADHTQSRSRQAWWPVWR